MTAPTAGLVHVEVSVRFSVVLVCFMRVRTRLPWVFDEIEDFAIAVISSTFGVFKPDSAGFEECSLVKLELRSVPLFVLSLSSLGDSGGEKQKANLPRAACPRAWAAWRISRRSFSVFARRSFSAFARRSFSAFVRSSLRLLSDSSEDQSL